MKFFQTAGNAVEALHRPSNFVRAQMSWCGLASLVFWQPVSD
jgi:hypothetical protein